MAAFSTIVAAAPSTVPGTDRSFINAGGINSMYTLKHPGPWFLQLLFCLPLQHFPYSEKV